MAAQRSLHQRRSRQRRVPYKFVLPSGFSQYCPQNRSFPYAWTVIKLHASRILHPPIGDQNPATPMRRYPVPSIPSPANRCPRDSPSSNQRKTVRTMVDSATHIKPARQAGCTKHIADMWRVRPAGTKLGIPWCQWWHPRQSWMPNSLPQIRVMSFHTSLPVITYIDSAVLTSSHTMPSVSGTNKNDITYVTANGQEISTDILLSCWPLFDNHPDVNYHLSFRQRWR